jgi:hypothetical protein
VEQDHEEDLKEEEVDDESYEEEENPEVEKEQHDIQVPPKTPNKRVQKNHPSKHIIGNKDARVETRRRIRSPEQKHLALISTIELSIFEEPSKDEFWIKAMDEELDKIENNDTWELVPGLKNNNVISTKWVFRNTLNEDGHITMKKTSLVCKGYAQVKV